VRAARAGFVLPLAGAATQSSAESNAN
jgi:hypothetical protein